MTPEEKALFDQQTKLIVDLQAKNKELLEKKVDQAAYDTAYAAIEKKYNELAAEIVKLKALPPGPSDDPKIRASEHKMAFIKFLRKGAENLAPAEVKVMTISDLTTGGYLATPNDLVREILANVQEYSPIRSLARVIPTSAPGVDWPKKTGTFAAYRTSEIGTRSETTGLAFGLEKIPADEMYALVKVSKQNLEDSAFPLESFITSEAAEQFGVKEGTESIAGIGASGQMEGILVNGSVTGYTGVTTDHVILADDMKRTFYLLKDVYAKNATWIWRRSSTLAISLLKDTVSGNYLWRYGLTDSDPATVLGRPYVECPDMPAEATAAKAVAVGDFKKAYVIVDRLGMETQRLVELYAANGEVGFLFRRRVGGQVVLPEAIKVLTLKA
jgi:HK97 family phage major capsid protein